MSRPRVVCLGDSITQRGFDVETSGWLALLQSKFCRSVDIINRGFSGFNTNWLLDQIDDLITDFESAEIVFILMGANDSAKDVQNVPVAKFSENLTKLVNKARDSGAKKIVLISTPWVDGPAWLKFSNANPESSQFGQSEPNRNEEAAKIYADSVAEVAGASDCDLIDFYSEMFKRKDKSSLLCDGLHLAPMGNKLLADLVSPFIETLKAPNQWPDWKEKA